MEKNEKERNNDYKVLYIGETKKSGYERGCEHLDDLKSLKENSHLLKHLIEVHPNLKVDELKVGMRIRKTFKSALERQIGEAIAIKVSQERGYTLMNSKSEYNRCKIPRIVIDTENETYKKLKIQEENDRIKKTSIRMMKKRKKSNEKEMKLSLQEICDENRSKWRLREIEKKKEKLETEQIERESYERMKRKNRAEMKKKKLIEKIKENSKIPEKKEINWIQEKKRNWRKYRERNELDEDDENAIFNELLLAVPVRKPRIFEEFSGQNREKSGQIEGKKRP